MLLQNLEPISGTNSVSQVVASIFVNGSLPEPNRFRKFLEKLNYQKFDLIKSRTLRIKLNSDNEFNKTSGLENDRGFRLNSFSDGRINNLIHGEQIVDEESVVTRFSFYSFRYYGWSDFLDKILNELLLITREDNNFVKAISLDYNNEFLWTGESDILVEDIFNSKNNYLSRSFFESKNSTFQLETESRKGEDNLIETIEILIDSKNSTVKLKVQVVVELGVIKKVESLIENSHIMTQFNLLHDAVKARLDDLLKEEVKQLISFR